MPYIDPRLDIRAPDRYFTSHEVGDILQVNSSSVVKWINDGLLNAFRTPGGHRRVSATELVRFARHHGMPVPPELSDLAVSKVLVIDDEDKFVSSLTRTLKAHPEFEIHGTSDATSGLIAAGHLKPDVMIVDLKMPGLDGYKLLEVVKADPAMANTQVIIVSGSLDDATENKCRKLGAMTCLQKPVKVPELVEVLRELRKPRNRWR